MMAIDRPGPGLPLLGRGKHRGPERGACLMEYVSVLAGADFTDRPRCTAPALAELGRRVNDGVGDAARRRLARLAPDLVEAGPCALADDLVVLCTAEAGLAVGPDHPALMRLRDRATWRLRHPRTGRLARLPGHGAVGEAYLAAVEAMNGLDPVERDARLEALLREALDAVRAARPAEESAPTTGRAETARLLTTPDADR